PISRFAARYLQVLGLGLFVLGIAASAIGVTVGSLPRTTAEVGIILLGSALILGARETIWRSPFRTLGVAALMLVFYVMIFEGGGRLRLAAMLLTIVVVAQSRVRTGFKT